MSEIYDIVVIGGGASALMLAANLDIGYSSGVVLEGTSSVGNKLMMSGGGRCNITHGGSIKDFVYAYGDAGNALRSCLYKHNNLELIAWLNERGLETLDEDGRIFPASMKARDVLDVLMREAADNKWQIDLNSKVFGLKREEDSDSWEIYVADRGKIRARNVVVASGGITFPKTGSDGSLFGMLRELGIGIKEPKSALAPVYVDDYPYADLAGISLSDVSVTTFGSDASCTCKGKSAGMTGDLLFTHEAFSGPVILNISKYAEAGELIRISYNKEFEELPKRMQKKLEDRARGESGDVKTKLLASLLDRDDFKVTAVSEQGMVTSGGVLLDDMDMKSMRSKKYDSLYVIGEALDADGITGGYNLQMCWSTARACADDLKKKI